MHVPTGKPPVTDCVGLVPAMFVAETSNTSCSHAEATASDVRTCVYDKSDD